MQEGKMFWIFIIITIVIVFSLLFLGGIFFFFSKASVMLQQSMPLSPLEDNILIKTIEGCTDSDGGIFFHEKGEVDFFRRVLFFNFPIKVEDRCQDNELTEYYCTEGGLGKGVVECERKCEEGKCVEIFSDN